MLRRTTARFSAAMLAAAAAATTASDAFAQKEQFVRSKPHVNVGTPAPSSPGDLTGAANGTAEANAAVECPADPSKNDGKAGGCPDAERPPQN